MADPVLTFEVIGNPKPQGSMRALMPRGASRPIVINSDDEPLRNWRIDMRDAARQAWEGQPPIEQPVAVNLLFRLACPQAPRWAFPGVPPDIDKLARAALDALTASRVIRDDARVVQLHVAKVYEQLGQPPGLVVKLWRVAG